MNVSTWKWRITRSSRKCNTRWAVTSIRRCLRVHGTNKTTLETHMWWQSLEAGINFTTIVENNDRLMAQRGTHSFIQLTGRQRCNDVSCTCITGEGWWVLERCRGGEGWVGAWKVQGGRGVVGAWKVQGGERGGGCLKGAGGGEGWWVLERCRGYTGFTWKSHAGVEQNYMKDAGGQYHIMQNRGGDWNM